MAYQKQTFIDDETILTATHLNNIENGIVQNESDIRGKADLDESGKLKSEQIPDNILKDEDLTQAVNTALTQAKESGDFKGEKGADGEKGEKGDSGVYIGSGAMPDGYNVQIDPEGEVFDFSSFKGDTGPRGADGYTPVKGTDYFTEADKAEIVASVIESLGGNPVVGYVDENNNIIVQGNLADGSYSVKYEMEGGSTVNIGNLVLDSTVYYSITNNLTQCTNSSDIKEIAEGSSYSATISANSDYVLKSVSVRMGGTDISASAVSGGNINIANVTGNIVITAVAEETVVEPKNLLPEAIFNTSEDPATSDKGYVSGYKISTSGGGMSQLSGGYTSGYIPVSSNDIVSIENITLRTDGNSNNVVLYSAANKASRIVGKAGPTGAFDSGVTVSNGVYSFKPSALGAGTNVAYFRFSCGGITDETIVTVTKV